MQVALYCGYYLCFCPTVSCLLRDMYPVLQMCTVDDAVANIGRGLRPSSLTSTLRQVLTEMLRPSDGVESAVMVRSRFMLRSACSVWVGLGCF